MLKRVRELAAGASGDEELGRELLSRLDDVKMLQAEQIIRLMRAGPAPARLGEAEFKVYSQFGDDGIIQYLIHQLAPLPDAFIEFGVEDYRESNTRYLLRRNNWRGLVMDGSHRNIDTIKRDPVYAQHELSAVEAFIDANNINGLIRAARFDRPLGLLSIDIDGNDYWVWRAIDCIEPVIVVCEYNSLFGWERAVSVPYDPGFERSKKHHSWLYWGCSLASLCHLANEKGYAFVGANSVGINAYFVRRDRLGELPERTAEEGFVLSRYRESRDEHGRLTYATGEERQALIASLPLEDVSTGERLTVAEL